MEAYRKYGNGVPRLVLVHGGPGAPGEMRPLAKMLEKKGIPSLEPLQSADSVDGQVEELYHQIMDAGLSDIFLLGYSWGAWLAILFAARYPDLVERLILVSTPPFTHAESLDISKRRMERLNEEQQKEIERCVQRMKSDELDERRDAFRSLALLFRESDGFSLLTDKEYVLDYQVDLFKSVWADAEERRASGKMLEAFKGLSQPLIFIHGNADSHKSTITIKLLKGLDIDAIYFEIPSCGHTPWLERFGQFRFLSIIENELRNN